MNQKLLDAIRADKVIFFIGSGFSKCFNFPDWDQLLINVLEELSIEESKLKYLIPIIQTGILSPIEVLNKISEHKSEIYDHIKTKFIIKKADESKLESHKKLWNISKKIITTNYDTALELANPKAEKIIYNYNYEVAKLHQAEEYLFKLHGSIEDISNCILFEEDYKKLYNESDKKCAIFQLEKLISENTIIFLGFSLKDPYICNIFESMNMIFSDFMSKHYIFSTGNDDFSKYSTNIIKLNNWDEIDAVLDQFINYKQQIGTQSINQNSVSASNTQVAKAINDNNKRKVALLIGDPLDKKLGFNMQEVSACFTNLDIYLDCFHLSIDKIRELDRYDYIFIFTKAIKGKIYIEDEYLKCTSVMLKDLEDNFCISGLKGIYIFLDDITKVKCDETTTPIIMCKNDIKLKDLLFKVLRRADRKYIESCCRVVNLNIDNIEVFNKGEAKINIFKANNLGFIDVKNTQGFIGRLNDLEAVIPKILNAKINGRILNIKGSGGIGKTTIIKKAVHELAKREYFKDGIYFIDCEHIENYSLFEHRISQCFELDNSIDFVNYITENNLDKKSLIILDNFETLLYLKDTNEIKELVKIISDYITIVITSREVVYSDTNVEDIYELRNFSTDEAVELFIHNYPFVKQEEIRILRTDILEELLNNNPLAINIVTKNLPKGKDIFFLKKELEQDFFTTIDDNVYGIYDAQSDFNIEKTRSLFQSINYSYKRLSEREGLAFKLLSLFPDGIDIEHFKEFFKQSLKQRKGNPITDTDLRMLQNKSLVEINHTKLKLQSIIRRFAQFQFDSLNEIDKKAFYKQAYQYNIFMVSIADKLFSKKHSYSYSFFDTFSSNIIESLNYLEKIDDENGNKLKYLCIVSDYFIYVARGMDFVEKLKKLQVHLCTTEKLTLLFEVTKIWCEFMIGDFKGSFEALRRCIDISEIKNLDCNDEIDREIIISALNIYFYEGYALESLEYYCNYEKDSLSQINIANFELGRFSKLKDDNSQKHFFSYQIDLALGKLDIESLLKHIDQIYKKDYIEIVQTTFLKSLLVDVGDKEINKLVVTNPYTKGLKKLMKAFNEKSQERKYKLYIDAISDLEHIKYYYVEAIFYFAKYLRETNDEKYTIWFKLGYENAVKYKFNFLIYKFNCLEFDTLEKYDEESFVDILAIKEREGLDSVAATKC